MNKLPFLEYCESVGYNRDVFMLNQSDALWAFRQIHDNFGNLGLPLSKCRDASGKSHVSLVPFVLLMQRQAMAAFWALASHQSYQTWVLLRPCVESALIIGKWVDDLENASIWSKRLEDPKTYRKTYQGKEMVSKSLPRSEDIRGVLRRINDNFLHPNPDYYYRHTELRDAGPESVFMLVHYFDREDAEHRANVFAFLHLLLVIQESLSQLVRDLFPRERRVKVGLDVFEKEFKAKVDEFLSENPQMRQLLVDFGLWELDEAV
jgi:hypothetical protein